MKASYFLQRMRLLCFASVSLVSLCAVAQTGQKSIGMLGGYASYNDGGYADIYFQYQVAPHFRIAPDAGYVFRSDGKSAFVMNADMQFPFALAKDFAIYPLMGFTFNNWEYPHDYNVTRGGVNIGTGFDIYLSRDIKMTLQGKYSIMNDTSGAFLGMGIGYVF